jgi:hypothetical protein
MELRKIWNNPFHKKSTLKKLGIQALTTYLLTSKNNLIDFITSYTHPENSKKFLCDNLLPKI